MASSSIIEWWVELGGDQQDLKDVAQSFGLNDTCRVDVETDGKYYLKSKILNELTNGNDVLARAEELILRINGAMMAQYSDFQPIHKTRGLVTLQANGNRGVVVVTEALTIRAKAGRLSIIIKGNEPPEPVPSYAERWLELSVSDDHVADTLMYLSREPNWFDLYKLYEVIRAATGSQSELPTRLSEGGNDRASLVKEIRRFTATVNAVHDIRHARPRNTPPENPMNLVEANEFIRDLASRYLRSRTC